MLESVVREFIVIFGKLVDARPVGNDGRYILLWLSDELGESLEFANKRKGVATGVAMQIMVALGRVST